MSEASDSSKPGCIPIWVAIIGFLGAIIAAIIMAIGPDLKGLFNKKSDTCASIIEQSNNIVNEVEKRLPFLVSEQDSINHLFYLQKFNDISRYSCDSIKSRKASIEKTINNAKKQLNL